jgi:hypothetical protein
MGTKLKVDKGGKLYLADNKLVTQDECCVQRECDVCGNCLTPRFVRLTVPDGFVAQGPVGPTTGGCRSGASCGVASGVFKLEPVVPETDKCTFASRSILVGGVKEADITCGIAAFKNCDDGRVDIEPLDVPRVRVNIGSSFFFWRVTTFASGPDNYFLEATYEEYSAPISPEVCNRHCSRWYRKFITPPGAPTPTDCCWHEVLPYASSASLDTGECTCAGKAGEAEGTLPAEVLVEGIGGPCCCTDPLEKTLNFTGVTLNARYAFNKTTSVGKALGVELNGSTQFLRIEDHVLLNHGGFISVGCWVKMDSTASDAYPIAKWETVGNQREWALKVEAGGDVSFTASNNGTLTDIVTVTPGITNTDQWFFIYGKYDNFAALLEVGIGSEVAGAITRNFKTGLLALFQSTSDVLIGAIGDSSPSDFFPGHIDSPYIYDEILTTAAHDYLYNLGDGRTHEELVAGSGAGNPGITNLTAFYKLDEATSQDRLNAVDTATLPALDAPGVALGTGWVNQATLVGEDVQKAKDLSGNRRHLRQMVVGNSPQFQFDSVNARTVTQFTAANSDFLDLPLGSWGSAVSQPVTIFAVVVFDTPASGTRQDLMSDNLGSGMIIQKDASDDRVINAGTAQADTAATSTAEVWLVIFDDDPTTENKSRLYVNGGAALLTNVDSSDGDLDSMAIGGAGSNFFDGKVAELSVVAGNLYLDNLAKLNSLGDAYAYNFGLTWTTVT